MFNIISHKSVFNIIFYAGYLAGREKGLNYFNRGPYLLQKKEMKKL